MNQHEQIIFYAIQYSGFVNQDGKLRMSTPQGVGVELRVKKDGSWYCVQIEDQSYVIYEGDDFESFQSLSNQLDWSFEPSSKNYPPRRKRRL